MLDGQKIEQVTSFVYLGQLVTQDGKNKAGIQKRIVLARNVFSKMQSAMCGRLLSMSQKHGP